jgi:hypothetical protein
MPVRGTTKWQHARLQKKIINRDEGGYGKVTESGTHYVICAWSTCTNDAYELYKVRINEGAPGYEPRIINFAFCSEKCKQHWLDEWQRQHPR